MRFRLLGAAALCAAFLVPASANAGVTMCDIDPSQRTVNVPCRVDGGTTGLTFTQHSRQVIGCDHSSPCGSFNSPPYTTFEGGIAYWNSAGVVGLDSYCVGWSAYACGNVDPGSPPTYGFDLVKPGVCVGSTSSCVKPVP